MNENVAKVRQIRADLKEFDGDKRGMFNALYVAEEAMDNEAVDRFAQAMKEKMAIARMKTAGTNTWKRTNHDT